MLDVMYGMVFTCCAPLHVTNFNLYPCHPYHLLSACSSPAQSTTLRYNAQLQ
jgi:hypothetical protein